MFDLIRLTGYILILIVVAGTAAVFQPDWARDLCLQDWAVDNWTVENIRLDQQRAAALDEANRVHARQLSCRHRVMRNVIDGRATLFEAAAVFHHLNQEHGALAFGPTFPGCTSDEEWSCRQLIRWVQCYAPEGSNGLVRRLEEQLRQHKEQYGTVILPKVATAI